LEYLVNLSGFQAVNSNITDADAAPLGLLLNLTSLNLENNTISDLSILSNKPLVTLNLNGNQIQDLTSLASLTTLQVLQLANNQITNVYPLAGLVNLLTLDLQNNRIGDRVQGFVDRLSALTFATLTLTNNPLLSCGELKLLNNAPSGPVVFAGSCTELPADPAKSTATITPYPGPEVQTRGSRAVIIVQARDVYGNPKTQGGDKVDATITGANPHAYSTTLPYPDQFDDNINGTYGKVYFPFNAGTDTITITLNDLLIDRDGHNGVYILEIDSPPSASILQPTTPIDIWPGTPVTFEATASDPEDSLGSMALQWVFNGGDLPAADTLGPHIVTFATPGEYTITFTATDSAGISSAVQSQTVVVGTPWGSSLPELIESVDGRPNSLKIAMDGANNVIAVWSQYWPLPVSENNITVNRYNAGSGVWEGEQFIDASSSTANAPEIAMASGGDALVVWQHYPENTLWSGRYDGQNNTWTPPLRVDITGATTPLRVATNDLGEVMAVWHMRDPITLLDNVYVNRYSFGSGLWNSPPDTIGSISSNNNVQHEAIAVNNSSNALALWMENVASSSDETIYGKSFTTGAGWGAETVLDIEAGSLPQVVIFDSGDALAVWGRNIKTTSGTITGKALVASRYNALSDSWGPAQEIHNVPGFYDSNIKMKLDNSGTITVLWYGDRSPPTPDHLFCIRYDSSSGTWGTLQQVDQFGGVGNQSPGLAVDDTGNAIAVWVSVWGSVWTNTYDVATDTWGDQKLLENDETGNARNPQVVMSNNGVATVVWQQPTGGSPIENIYSIRLDLKAP
jgi:hypothetical protein